jgi:hypothetical protein
MATAKVIEKCTRTYTLELNQDEAEFLLSLVGKVSGCFVSSRRKHCNFIASALRGCGLQPNYSDLSGSVHAITL